MGGLHCYLHMAVGVALLCVHGMRIDAVTGNVSDPATLMHGHTRSSGMSCFGLAVIVLNISQIDSWELNASSRGEMMQYWPW